MGEVGSFFFFAWEKLSDAGLGSACTFECFANSQALPLPSRLLHTVVTLKI